MAGDQHASTHDLNSPSPSKTNGLSNPPNHFAMHFMNPLVSSSLFKFLPMKIILHLRSSPSAQEPCFEFAKSMWMAWKTNFSFIPATARTPFERKRSTPFSFKSQSIHSFNLSDNTSPPM